MDKNSNLSEYTVSISNRLVRSSHSLSLPEKRLVAAAIAKVDSRMGSANHAHLSEFQKIRITALDYSETYGVDPKNAYAHLQIAAKNLFDRYVTIKTQGKKINSERVTNFRWVSSCSYAKDEGFIELSFTPEIHPHLHALKREYTSYKLKNAAGLRSVYSWRIYEIAQSWLKECNKNNKPVLWHLTDIKHALQVPDTYRYQEIRRRALEPAIIEIKKISNLEISFSPKKKGRSIVALEVFVKEFK